MPKRPTDFPERIETWVPEETRVQLMAIAYHMGARGQISTPVRNFVTQGIRAYMEGLQGRALKDFEEILANVRVQMIK